MFFVIYLDEHRTDYTVCGTCNSRGNEMIITIYVRHHRPISDRFVADKNASAKSKFVSMLDKHTHMVVWTANVDVLVLEVRLKLRP